MPANASTGASTSPTLSVHVSDPDSDPLTVTFFGRPLASGNYTQIAQNTNVASNTDSTTNAWANLGGGQTFQWYATVKDATHTAVTGPTWTFHTTASTDPVFVGAGDIGSCDVTEDTDTGNVIKGIDGSIFTTGDNVYDKGLASEFTNCYATTPWGDSSVKTRTRPVPGNHDWGNTGTALTTSTATSATTERMRPTAAGRATTATTSRRATGTSSTSTASARTFRAAAQPARRRNSGSRPT